MASCWVLRGVSCVRAKVSCGAGCLKSRSWLSSARPWNIIWAGQGWAGGSKLPSPLLSHPRIMSWPTVVVWAACTPIFCLSGDPAELACSYLCIAVLLHEKIIWTLREQCTVSYFSRTGVLFSSIGLCEFGCQNMYLKFCKGEKMWLYRCSQHHRSVQMAITLCRAWAGEVTVSAGIYGEAVWPFVSLSATAASEICCPLLIGWSWYLKHSECFTAQVSRIWNKISYNCYRQGGFMVIMFQWQCQGKHQELSADVYLQTFLHSLKITVIGAEKAGTAWSLPLQESNSIDR